MARCTAHRKKGAMPFELLGNRLDAALQMSAASPPPAAPVPQKRRRWLRRAFLAGLGVVLGLVLFHRPLGHWAIRHFGTSGLAKAGITGTWKTSGSLLGGLNIDDLQLTGNDRSELQSVTLRHAALEYDLWELRGGGHGKVLKRLVVQNLELNLDLSKPRPPGLEPKSSKLRTKPQLPSVALPEIRIEHLTVRLQLPHEQVLIRDFSLVLDPSARGSLSAALLELPGTPRLENVSGLTGLKPQEITFSNLTLAPGLMIENLVLDLSRLANDEAAMEIKAHQGPAQIALSAASGAWFTSTTADLNLQAANVSNETLAFWGIPSGSTAWQGGTLALTAKGPILKPDRMEAKLSLGDAGFSIDGTGITPISLEATMSRGKATLTQLSAALGTTLLKASGGSTLPESWADIAKLTGTLDFTLSSPQVSEALPAGLDITGKMAAEGSVAFGGQKLIKLSAQLSGSAMKIQGIPVEQVATKARLVDDVVFLDAAQITLNAQNTFSASGKLELQGARPLELHWQADARDLSTVPAEARAGLPWPGAGRVKSSGSATGSLTGWQAGDWTSLNGNAMVDAEGVKVQQASLQKLTLMAEARQGSIDLQNLLLRLDAENRVDAAGTLNLADPTLALTGRVSVRIPDIARLSAWSAQSGGPALHSGKAELDWQGTGCLHPMQMLSNGSATVNDFRMEGLPEALSLSMDLHQNGGEARIGKLKAAAGPWRAEASATYNGWHLEVPRLTAFAKDQQLLDLSARIPFHEGTIPPDSPLSLHLKMEDVDAAELATALGRTFPVKGILKVEADFEGTLQRLEGTLTAEATQVAPLQPAPGLKLEPANARIAARLHQGRLNLDGTARQLPLQPLALTASLPLNLASLMSQPGHAQQLPVTAQLKLPASSLAFLPSWIPVLRKVDGTAAADFSVTGTLGKPIWQGGVSVLASGASFTSGSLPTVKDLNLKLRINEHRLTLDEVSVMLAGGRLQLSGGAGLENPLDPLLDLKLVADEILVLRDENLSLRANAAITCRGPVSRAGLRGQVDFVRGRVFKEIEFLPLSLPNDLPPPPPPTTPGTRGAPALPAPFDQWNFDIAIKTRDPVRLMGNVARGNAVADLKLSGLGSKPELTGKVRLEEMWLKLPFSRLNVTDGSLTFTREQPFDPSIDITGESITGNRIVQVFVQGRALDPKVRLTSSPPLPEGEIASLLATGVTTSDLSSRGDEAAGRAAFVLLKQTYRKLFPNSATSSDDDDPPKLSFDFSVFGSDPSRRGVSAIYELNPRWRIIGRVGETGTFRGLLHYLIRFR